jgi:hypothetical protein
MRNLLASLILLLGFPCLGEELRCPQSDPIDIPTPFEKWKPKYFGFLEQVMLVRLYYGESKTVLTCKREDGVQELGTAKKCRLIAGQGDLQIGHQDKRSESFWCNMPKPNGYHYQMDSCLIICD